MNAAKLNPNAATPTTSPSAPLTATSIAPPRKTWPRLRAIRPIVNSSPRKKSRKTRPICATKSVTSEGRTTLRAEAFLQHAPDEALDLDDRLARHVGQDQRLVVPVARRLQRCQDRRRGV